MTLRRLLLLAGILLILFLGMYSWNQRTRVLDDLAAKLGLEITGAVLTPVRSAQDAAENMWDRYFDLVGVREENEALKQKVDELEARLLANGEDLAELKRLRALVQLPVDQTWRPLGARVLSGRMGPNAVLDSITISRGAHGPVRFAGAFCAQGFSARRALYWLRAGIFRPYQLVRPGPSAHARTLEQKGLLWRRLPHWSWQKPRRKLPVMRLPLMPELSP